MSKKESTTKDFDLQAMFRQLEEQANTPHRHGRPESDIEQYEKHLQKGYGK